MSNGPECNGGRADAYFNIPELDKHFQNCLLEDEDIELDSYLEAYKELIKFCTILGNVFSFVRDEIESKSQILRELKVVRADDFKTLKGMVAYEMGSNLLNKKDYVSGCRTLLRLHWGLDFLKTFLKRVHECGPEAKISSVGRQVYHETLGTHHTWYIRMIVPAAMSLLPTKSRLVETLCGGELDKSIVEHMPAMLDTANEVYARTEKVYRNNELLNLE